ncbi:ferrous iron transport protein B [Corynebacterium auriscanis]|uniref:ferrous iron transport protein B n=1 Tax=Corynebacterium auriscanis TaxID=99807 RepID=UPI0022464FB6|nr:ferrous iron transport protein B [Corynebacterium auriscanis]MCX2162285.1 ferrous iron transport protein B [Corynebacterium auriscanis]
MSNTVPFNGSSSGHSSGPTSQHTSHARSTSTPTATHLTSCHSDSHGDIAPEGAPVIALVGAPNAGKSTLFNGLTGAKAQMGNWPGTTVEVSRGAWKIDPICDVIDFPGAYSLDPISPDEALTRELIIDCAIEERPDLVMVAVDASALSRSLYMVAQLAEQSHRLLLVLTKTDVAATMGTPVDAEALSHAVGAPVVEVDPRRRSNLAAVGEAARAALQQEPATRRTATATEEFELADERFTWIDEVTEHAILPSGPAVSSTTSEKIDRFALHPVFGPLLFLGVMWLVFQVTTTVAAPLQDGLDTLFTGPVSSAATSLLDTIGLRHRFFQGLIVDGLIGGVGMVLTFAPLMALMFVLLAILEDSGYMARAAVVTDRAMKLIGLPGKAFIPLIVGFGCNVPAISATRVLASPHQRIQTALLVPFTSCSARLTVYVMLAATFFPNHAGNVVFLMYVISIALVVGIGFLMKKALWRKMGNDPLVIDLPTYQFPGARLVLSVAWVRLKGFLKTAGGIIVVTVIVVFALQATPVRGEAGFADENLAPQDSAYGAISQTVSPIFAPAGFDSWSLTGPLITGFVAKEAVISSWAQTYALEEDSPDLSTAVRADFEAASNGHPLAAVWAFMLFLLAYTPCVATIAAQRREIGWRWTVAGIGIQLTTAWVLAVLAFNLLKIWL